MSKTRIELFNELIDEAKKKLGFGDEAPEQKFMDVTTEDGTVLKVSGEALAEGAAVTTQAGEVAADGDYKLGDGTTITVAGGTITAIKPAESTDEAMADDAAKGMDALKQQLADVLSQFSAQQKEIEALKAANVKREQAFSAQKEAVSKLIEVVEEMANEPAAAPVVKKKSMFATDKPNPQARIQQIAEAVRKINTQNKNS